MSTKDTTPSKKELLNRSVAAMLESTRRMSEATRTLACAVISAGGSVRITAEMLDNLPHHAMNVEQGSDGGMTLHVHRVDDAPDSVPTIRAMSRNARPYSTVCRDCGGALLGDGYAHVTQCGTDAP